MVRRRSRSPANSSRAPDDTAADDPDTFVGPDRDQFLNLNRSASLMTMTSDHDGLTRQLSNGRVNAGTVAAQRHAAEGQRRAVLRTAGRPPGGGVDQHRRVARRGREVRTAGSRPGPALHLVGCTLLNAQVPELGAGDVEVTSAGNRRMRPRGQFAEIAAIAGSESKRQRRSVGENPGVLAAGTGRRVRDPRSSVGHPGQRGGQDMRCHRAAGCPP